MLIALQFASDDLGALTCQLPPRFRSLNWFLMGKQLPHGIPKDTDGNTLCSLIANGSDLSKPMYVNFQVAVPDEESATSLAAVARKLGYQVNVYDSPECRLPWTCECSTRMLATYDGVIAIQAELAEISEPFGGDPDGWGSFGNGPTGQPDVR